LAPLFLARTRAGSARMLVADGGPEDLDRAQLMLEEADDTAAHKRFTGDTGIQVY
jgi:hypothetical protein